MTRIKRIRAASYCEFTVFTPSFHTPRVLLSTIDSALHGSEWCSAEVPVR
jgi:hypothetical protein